MFFELTYQVRVADFSEGQKWYETLLDRVPDFVPHEGFVEWEIIPGFWLQVAEGDTTMGSGPLRLAVEDIIREKNRMIKELNIENFEIHSRDEVPVKWGTFSDPWGNRVGFYEYHNKEEEEERIKTLLIKEKI
ncbi:VOC family protein [Paenibacillus sp. Marseille-Q4541]|uniref:VOC family protein n=1 Tax=Paenibacillus sp. Marseille-Q4541 TaxID=2831522 RepID=UPI001BACBEAD|nr:VOC family protein [Paenibacillus sp. Marseille-Q4541]